MDLFQQQTEALEKQKQVKATRLLHEIKFAFLNHLLILFHLFEQLADSVDGELPPPNSIVCFRVLLIDTFLLISVILQFNIET